MSDSNCDSDVTVVDLDIDKLLNKYKVYDGVHKKQIVDSACSTMSPVNKKSKKTDVNELNQMDEVDAILNDLATVYNIDVSPNKAHQSADTASNVDLKNNKPVHKYSISDDDEYIHTERYPLKSSSDILSSNNYCIPFTNNISDDDNESETTGPFVTSKGPNVAKLLLQKQHEQAKTSRLEKQKERENKKEEAERAKGIKKALTAANKNSKPEECIKFITVLVDFEIMQNNYSSEIANNIETLGAKLNTQSQIVPNTVTWVRNVQSHLINDEGQLQLSSCTEEAEQVLLLMTWHEVVALVHKEALLAHVKGVQTAFGEKKISLAIFGMGEYIKYMKRQKNNTENPGKGDRAFAAAARITRRQLEFALTELQLLCGCCYRLLETAADLGAMIAQFTKSIAQAPYKLEKQEKHMLAEWYMSGDNKDCVRVDKNGNGLKRLWQQQLTSFPLARIETAESIMSNYPTITHLFEAYDQCDNKEKLLQEIPIRRAAGPLTTVRKIGPELSRKAATFYNATDGDVNIV